MTPESNEQIETAKDSAAVVTELAASDDPRAVSETLREQPVVRIGDMFTLVTRRKDVEASLRNPAVFSSNSDAVKLGNVRPLIPLQIDPPKHVKYRRVLDPMFAPREVAKLEPEVVTIVNSLIDEFSSKGTCDFHERVAVPLPCTVFLRLMGLPYSELERFLAMKDGIVRPPGETLESQAPVRDETAREIYAYFQEVIDERRSSPGDDLITRITNFELDGERLTDDEVLDICFLFIIAGLDTVTDSLDCIFAHLAQNPADRQEIVEDPSVIPSAVEELLRWENPVPAVARVALKDAEIEGCPIHAGEQVMIVLASANTDPAHDPGLTNVDLRRNPNPHLAFGGGVHRCLGSHLARLELRVALREFHLRIPEYSLAPGTHLKYTTGLRSLHELPLVFSAVENA
ncbi:MAG: cytochrome P450 [Acidimicrobiales bacterium]